jgi:hypothetical protein
MCLAGQDWIDNTFGQAHTAHAVRLTKGGVFNGKHGRSYGYSKEVREFRPRRLYPH